MKMLNGKELAEFIKERQYRQVHGLLDSGITPKLAIIKTVDDPAINTYVRLKQKYGADLGVEVDIHEIDQADAISSIKALNQDQSVNGIIVQLPLKDPKESDRVLNAVAPGKDVDGLAKDTIFDPATPTAILWLLSGYNVDLQGKTVAIVGRGKLVGEPLARILMNSGVNVMVTDRSTKELKRIALDSDVIVTATGSPALIKPDMISQNAVVVDAGVAVAEGKTVGDLDHEVYERDDITVTPKKGGVGPLTICALFENVIQAASKV